VVGGGTDNQVELLGDRPLVVPSISVLSPHEQEELAEAQDVHGFVEDLAEGIRVKVVDLSGQNTKTVRVDIPFASEPAWRKPSLEGAADPDTVKTYLGHVLFEELASRGFHAQLFIGIERAAPGYEPRSGSHQAFALNDPGYLARLHPIFDMYGPEGDGGGGCTFEILSGAEQSALDIVQAARIYRNVYPGGLWWFNFRASTYRANMQYRLEGLSALRSTLVASDARCIEWAFIKTMYVKQLLADFLYRRIEGGWIDIETALFTARSWLHDTAAEIYERPAP
jgi:glucuronate isomerase